ncbi:hypothetical protein GOV12_00890 [Candidatus Pacearchaeota archaeon]|nr:hypothetical protein [Candidatus Pacearchaeota archaeon]
MGESDNIIKEIIPRYVNKYTGSLNPPSAHKLIYDSSSETLEPVYFWILDFLRKTGANVEKLVDNFASSPGGGHFGDMMGRQSQMQQEASRVLATVNTILKGVINLIYDIKEFKIRLSHYIESKSANPNVRQAALLALKQIWMDKVDIQRGQGSINAMSSGNLQFITLRDSFMMVNSVKDVENLDLNDRVKRVLKPRVQEFFEWKIRSEQELRKRFEVEKIYLKSQVSALKLNARWAKPYLKAANQLAQNETLSNNAGMVTMFNTIMLQLDLMAVYGAIDVPDLCAQSPPELPREFKSMKKLREIYPVIFLDFNFRGIPNKYNQHYTFGGRVEVNFKAFGLTKDELILIRYKLEENDLSESLKLVQGMTDDSLMQIQADIEDIFEDDIKDEIEVNDSNPFSALFSLLIPQRKTEKIDKSKEYEKNVLDYYKKNKKLKSDNYAEEYIRNYSEAFAMNRCFNVYDKYKKAHGMETFPYGGDDNEVSVPTTAPERFFNFK